MKYNNLYHKHKFLISGLLFVLAQCGPVFGQSEYRPYSYQLYQNFNAERYSTKTSIHTTFNSNFGDSIIQHQFDSITNYGLILKQKSPAFQKIFQEHLIKISSPVSNFYADILPDLSLGREFAGNLPISTRSIGFQFGGTVRKKFSYYVGAYKNRANVQNYISTYINQVGIVPGQSDAKIYNKNVYDWTYITATALYSPSNFLNIATGRDKTFIGDGYRSLLLSDYASPYLFFKLTATLGNLKYMAMWSYMNDPITTSQYHLERKKFGVFHYLDWNVNQRLSFGFFENIIGFFTDDNGQKRPFDFNYISPLIFLKPLNNASDDPDKSLLGLTSKYKLSNGLTMYGQFALNELHSKDFFSSNGAYTNKYGFQIGLKGSNLFKINALNFLLEANSVKPYTYSARSAIENYSNNGEPLAHPWGANFREIVGLLNYRYKRVDFSFEFDLGRFGLDVNGLNYGKDIFQIYTKPARFYGNYTGQGLVTNLIYLEGKAAFILNPRYNLRFELSGILRTEKNIQFNDKTSMITFGLKSSFRNFYSDITRYKAN